MEKYSPALWLCGGEKKLTSIPLKCSQCSIWWNLCLWFVPNPVIIHMKEKKPWKVWPDLAWRDASDKTTIVLTLWEQLHSFNVILHRDVHALQTLNINNVSLLLKKLIRFSCCSFASKVYWFCAQCYLTFVPNMFLHTDVTVEQFFPMYSRRPRRSWTRAHLLYAKDVIAI